MPRLCLKCDQETSNRFLCDGCRKVNARERPGIYGAYSPFRGREGFWVKRNRAAKAVARTIEEKTVGIVPEVS